MIEYVNKKIEQMKSDGFTTDELKKLCKFIEESKSIDLDPLDVVLELTKGHPSPSDVRKPQVTWEYTDSYKVDATKKNYDPKGLLNNDVIERREWKDSLDLKQLNGGTRKFGPEEWSGYLDRTPMFFRSNGANIPLENMYKEGACFIVSNGPSMKSVDWNKLKQPGIITYGLNNGGAFFRPNIWTCVDNPIKFIDSIWLDPTIMKIIPQGLMEKFIFDFKTQEVSPTRVRDCPNVVGFRRNELFNKDTFLTEETINWGLHGKLGGGRSVNIAMLRIAFLLGFTRIYLVGWDFDFSNKDPYFFEEDRKNEKHQNGVFAKKNDLYFKEIKPEFEKFGVKIVNCTKDSKLTVFDTMDLDEAINKEKLELYSDIRGYDHAVCPKLTNGN